MPIEPIGHKLEYVLAPVIHGDDVPGAGDPDELLITGSNSFKGTLRGVGRDAIVIARLHHERR
jgi:hypothetical protein